jgi:UDPglucose 6-dehydrogenase
VAELAVIGCGHVGLVVGACFAELGHRVECIDIDVPRVQALQRGVTPLHEPGLDELVASGLASGRLRFRAGFPDLLEASIVFVAVNTPSSTEGAANLRAVRDAIAALAPCIRPGTVIVNKSTVPIGTGDIVEYIAQRGGAERVAVLSNPEFLQEGTAVRNFMEPDRVVLGSADAAAIERVAALYEPLGAPIIRTDIRTAEMIKYASNAFLATKISFINEIAAICEAVDADVTEVARGMGADPRIGADFLRAGLGWGGSCFPKDVQSLAHIAAAQGTHPQLLRSVLDINSDQRRRTLQKVRQALGGLDGRRVLVLGAAFKPNTDDTRHSPALELADLLQLEGAEVTVVDPQVPAARVHADYPWLNVAPSLLDGAAGAHALVLATEWAEFRELPYYALRAAMARPLIVDARNVLDGDAACAAGFEYRCIGRPAAERVPATPELATAGDAP